MEQEEDGARGASPAAGADARDEAHSPFLRALRRHKELRDRHAAAPGAAERAASGAFGDAAAARRPEATEQIALMEHQRELQRRLDAHRARRARGLGRERWAGVRTVVASLGIGALIGAFAVGVAADSRALADLRLAAARLVLPAEVRPRLDMALVGELAPAAGEPAEPAVAELDETAADVEQRLLAMLEQSDLAMRQLAELDRLRDAQIRRLEAARLPAWGSPGGADAAERRILDMMLAGGALDALDLPAPAAGAAVRAAADASVDTGGDAGSADARILAMVGGERGLLGTLDTLDQLRAQVAANLAEVDPTAAELRRLAALERALRRLRVYLVQLETELAGPTPVAAAAVPLPTLGDVAALDDDAPLGAELVALIERTRFLHDEVAALGRP